MSSLFRPAGTRDQFRRVGMAGAEFPFHVEEFASVGTDTAADQAAARADAFGHALERLHGGQAVDVARDVFVGLVGIEHADRILAAAVVVVVVAVGRHCCVRRVGFSSTSSTTLTAKCPGSNSSSHTRPTTPTNPNSSAMRLTTISVGTLPRFVHATDK